MAPGAKSAASACRRAWVGAVRRAREWVVAARRDGAGAWGWSVGAGGSGVGMGVVPGGPRAAEKEGWETRAGMQGGRGRCRENAGRRVSAGVAGGRVMLEGRRGVVGNHVMRGLMLWVVWVAMKCGLPSGEGMKVRSWEGWMVWERRWSEDEEGMLMALSAGVFLNASPAQNRR